MDTRYKIMETEYKIQDNGYRIQDTRKWIQDTRYKIMDTILELNLESMLQPEITIKLQDYTNKKC